MENREKIKEDQLKTAALLQILLQLASKQGDATQSAFDYALYGPGFVTGNPDTSQGGNGNGNAYQGERRGRDGGTGGPADNGEYGGNGSFERGFQGNSAPGEYDQLGLSSNAGNRALNSLGQTGAGMLKNAAINAGVAGLMDGDILGAGLAGLMNPSQLLRGIPNAMFAGLGVERPQGIPGSVLANLPAGLLAALGIANPAIGLTAGILGTPFADAVGDFTGMRSYDKPRDQLEDNIGEINGRMAYADFGRNIRDKSTLENANSFQEAANRERVRANTKTSVDAIQAALEKANSYQTLADISEAGSRNRPATTPTGGLMTGSGTYAGDYNDYYSGRSNGGRDNSGSERDSRSGSYDRGGLDNRGMW